MSINLTLGAIVVLLAGLVLNFKSSKERQENGEWSSGLQWSYLLCMVGVFGILSEFMSFTAVLLVFVVFTGIVWAIHKGRLKKSGILARKAAKKPQAQPAAATFQTAALL